MDATTTEMDYDRTGRATRRSKMPATKQNALRMVRGKGDAAVTCYSCGVIDDAIENGVDVIVMRRNKSGKMVEVPAEPRKVHRTDFLGTYGDTHELAGEGKYISTEAFSKGRKRVVGAQHVNPYLKDDGAFSTIVEVLKSSISKRILFKLSALVSETRLSGTHLLWEGKRNADGFCPGACSSLLTREEIWDLSLQSNADLLKILRKSKSGRPGVKAHKSPQEKFFGDLDVLRRATCVVDVSTGEHKFCGGRTPYSKPLEQCGFAIDRRFLTYGVDSDGNELGQYYYQFVIGRPEPHSLPRASWVYEGVGSSVAFKNEAARRKVRAA